MTPLTRVCALAALVVLGCAFSLVGAKSAPAALSWSTSASCVPCFDVAVFVEGAGHVSGVSPGQPDAGRIECAPQVVNGQAYDCEYYFLWLDGDPTVILTATADAGFVFSGWEPGNETSVGCPQNGPAANQCTLNLDNTPLGTCIKVVFTGSGGFGACPTEPPPPPGCSPNCGSSPPPPPPPPPPPAILNTTYLAKPLKTTRKRTATFRWAAYRSGHKVTGMRSQCRLDKQTLWKSCKSPRYLTRLKPGYHTMRVRVGDSVGATSVRWDKTPATYTWRIKR